MTNIVKYFIYIYIMLILVKECNVLLELLDFSCKKCYSNITIKI